MRPNSNKQHATSNKHSTAQHSTAQHVCFRFFSWREQSLGLGGQSLTTAKAHPLLLLMAAPSERKTVTSRHQATKAKRICRPCRPSLRMGMLSA